MVRNSLNGTSVVFNQYSQKHKVNPTPTCDKKSNFESHDIFLGQLRPEYLKVKENSYKNQFKKNEETYEICL